MPCLYNVYAITSYPNNRSVGIIFAYFRLGKVVGNAPICDENVPYEKSLKTNDLLKNRHTAHLKKFYEFVWLTHFCIMLSMHISFDMDQNNCYINIELVKKFQNPYYRTIIDRSIAVQRKGVIINDYISKIRIRSSKYITFVNWKYAFVPVIWNL